MSRELEKQISQLNKLIDSQISEFNISIIKSSIGKGGVTDRQKKAYRTKVQRDTSFLN